MKNEKGYNATQVDTGWRIKETEANSLNATQVDTGWRIKETEANSLNATQVDTGWRSKEAEANSLNATQVDTGWRSKEAEANNRNATQVDAGWRQAEQEIPNAAEIMNQAAANAFVSIETFKEAVRKLSQLVSNTNKVYRVKRIISCAGGESVILLCAAPDESDVAAKVYYEPVNNAGSSSADRLRVLRYMETKEGKKYTLAVQDIGLAELGGSSYYFEIMPYCAAGDLTHEKAFSFDEIVEVTQYLNEALHSMHKADILHRDIKPSNLYRMDGRIVIGDFGVAKRVRAGVTRHTAGTDGYRAPESTLAVSGKESAFFFDEKCDYYSLGVTLGSLFQGEDIYETAKPGEWMLAVRDSRLPLKKTDSNIEQLENLLNGLCRYDSKARFGYEEVKKWLVDHNYSGEVMDDGWPKVFRMPGEEYRDEKSLFYGITKDRAHWEEGKNMLYNKTFEHFFKSFRTDLANIAQKCEEEYRNADRDKGLSLFLKKLFAPGPLVWKGYTFEDIGKLGEKMAVTKTPELYGELLQRRCISYWLNNTTGIKRDKQTLNFVNDAEKLSDSEPELACYFFGNRFVKEITFEICGRKVHNIGEMIQALFASPAEFYLGDGLRKLLSIKEGAELYSVLYNLGYWKNVEAARKNFTHNNLFMKTVYTLVLLDDIAVLEKVDASPIRKFFVEYGPLGMAVYTKKLIERRENSVYRPLDAQGKKILSDIAEFCVLNQGTTREIFKANMPLMKMVEELKGKLIDNPYCLRSGIYESRGIICTNLVGSFSFKFLGQTAPLGFSSWIENNGKVKKYEIY